MPCNCDYMEPTVAEQQRKEAAMLVEYVMEQTSQEVPKTIVNAASDIYGHGGGDVSLDVDTMVSWLCDKIKAFTEEQENAILYDGRKPMARRLADWWEVHKVEDAKRERIEKCEYAARMATPLYVVWDDQGRHLVTTQFYRVAYDEAIQSGGAIQRVNLHANDFALQKPDDCGE